MTDGGGANGMGSVFRINTDGSGYQTLASFTGSGGANPGSYPVGGLVLSGSSLYGTTQQGGASGGGVLFSVNTDGSGFQDLVSFSGSNGYCPDAGLTLSGSTLYGTTWGNPPSGPSNYGSVFSIGTNGSGFQTLHWFSNTDGYGPDGPLTLSGSTLYGTCFSGGTGGNYNTNYIGPGTVFSINTNGSGFQNVYNCTPTGGGNPRNCALALSGSTLLGTFSGGTSMIFSVNTDGSAYKSLLAQSGTSQGNFPIAGLTPVGTAFYGTLDWGGLAGGPGGTNGNGVIYRINPDGSGFQDLVLFNGANGSGPCGGLTPNGQYVYGMTSGGGVNGYGTIYALNVYAPTVALTNPLGATIITGGTATLGATVANAAPAYCNNLSYTMTAAFQSGSGTVGTFAPAAGTLAPSASQSCTVAVTSTSLGSNTIALTASDSNSTNLSQTTSATLTVLDHAAATATVTSGNGFLLHAGSAGLASATITLNNASGTRSALQVNSAPGIGSGTLSGGAATPYYLSAGSAQTYTASFNVGNTPGVFSDPVTFSALGDNQSLSGCNPLGTLTVAVTGNVFSGNGVWSSSSGSLWSANGNWSDANAAGVHARRAPSAATRTPIRRPSAAPVRSPPSASAARRPASMP